MPIVSVIIPTYNRAAYVGQAIESVCRQTLQEWELMVVDDGSTDQTREVVAHYLTDRRIRYLSQTHQERSAARNLGIVSSSAPYVALLDADDFWMPDKLAKQVTAMAQHPKVGLCYTLIRQVDEQGRTLDPIRDGRARAGRILSYVLQDNCIGTSSVLIRRHCLGRSGLFDTSLPAYGREDWDLWIRLTRWYPVLPLEEELTLHRVHAGNSSCEQNFRSGLAVLDKLCQDRALLVEAGMSRAALSAYLRLSSAASPSPDIRRWTRTKRFAWAALHYPPCALSRMALIAAARLLLPRAVVKPLRSGYRRVVAHELRLGGKAAKPGEPIADASFAQTP